MLLSALFIYCIFHFFIIVIIYFSFLSLPWLIYFFLFPLLKVHKRLNVFAFQFVVTKVVHFKEERSKTVTRISFCTVYAETSVTVSSDR